MPDEELYLRHLHERGFLQALLLDRASRKHVIWATDTYRNMGCPGLGKRDEIDPEILIRHYGRLAHMRRQKRPDRTRSHGEVFTPTHICKRMCDHAHAVLYNDDWQKFVAAPVLEITCGEAPFLASRRHQDSGQLLPVPERFGLLDRKLQVINEKARDLQQWKEWAFRAFEATYGYEFQGDNLLLARINLFRTFEGYLSHRWFAQPTGEDYTRLLDIIVWNIWQMDGLTGTLPLGKVARTTQGSLFASAYSHESSAPPCLIRNWKTHKVITWLSITGEREMKFDFVIGNPPYQEESVGDQKTFAPPVYNIFMDASYEVADKVELIHPGRFLFNAGSTPKEWNKKMLEDPHLKVLFYASDASEIFPGTEIKGGIAVTYRDKTRNFGAINIFTQFPELNNIISKIIQNGHFKSFSSIVVTRTAYRLTDKLHKDYPDAINQLSDGHAYDMSTNIFTRLPQVFFNDIPLDGHKYIKILGRKDNNRVYKYIRKDYVNEVVNLHKYKIYLPKANGAGKLGEILAAPVISEPGTGSTETFIGIGSFNAKEEAENTLKYIRCKFTRLMLGVLKTTQDITPEKWRYVPLQDFTSSSDIDWTKSIPEIDRQLYAKYGLDDGEIEFIESHVKEMA